MTDITVDISSQSIDVTSTTTSITIEAGTPAVSNIMRATTYDAAGKAEQVLTVSDLLDEDNFASDSATKVPSQQSTKAYIPTAIAPAINAATAKTTPVDADLLGLVDSEASNVLKKLTWANLKATLAAIFVTGPSSASDNALVRYDGATGKLVQNSVATVADNGDLVIGPTFTSGSGASTGDATLEVGGLRSGDGPSVIDFHSTSGSDYEGRFNRQGGANGALLFQQRGTGGLFFLAENASAVHFYTTNVSRCSIGASGGMVMYSAGAAPTGGYVADGTINAFGFYDESVAVTDLVAEFMETGTVDVEKWDATVPDLVIPARVEKIPVMEDVTIEETYEFEDEKTGLTILKTREVTIQRRVKAFIPLHDEDGNGVDARAVELFEEVEHPERVVKREHYAARMFKDMIDAGFDPRDPRAYCAKVKELGALPGMPNLADWQEKKFSLGELHTRNTLATEIMQCAFASLVDEIDAMEARLSALDGRR